MLKNMRRINNPWLGNPAYDCFGCCPDNPLGTHMRFYEEGDDIVSVWQPKQHFQSWINTLHGGIQATLLDEVCGWVIFHKMQTAGVTAKMEIRYRKPVDTRQPYIILRARVQEKKRNVVIVKGEIWSAENELLAECECTYFTFSQKEAEEKMGFLPSTLADEETSLDDIKNQCK